MDTAGTGICSVQIYSAFYQVDKYAVSGGAAEIMLWLLASSQMLGDIPAYLVHVVHDELIAEVPDEHAEETLADVDNAMGTTSLFENIPQRGLVEGDIGRLGARQSKVLIDVRVI